MTFASASNPFSKQLRNYDQVSVKSQAKRRGDDPDYLTARIAHSAGDWGSIRANRHSDHSTRYHVLGRRWTRPKPAARRTHSDVRVAQGTAVLVPDAVLRPLAGSGPKAGRAERVCRCWWAQVCPPHLGP